MQVFDLKKRWMQSHDLQQQFCWICGRKYSRFHYKNNIIFENKKDFVNKRPRNAKY
jgi:hypothetical protein